MISAENRHHHERMQERVKSFYWYYGYANRFAKNRKRCSCYMCGNPRKHFKDITIQEKQSNHSFQDQLKEAYENI